jgi:hypothetical protein
MALRIDYSAQNNFGTTQVLTNCYVKVNHIRGNKLLLKADVDFIVNDDDGAVIQKTYSFIPSVDDNSSNFIKQAYEHLKTLDEFAGATDV